MEGASSIQVEVAVLIWVIVEWSSPRTSIIVAQPDIFDYSAGEPPTHLTTVLRVLEVGLSQL
jgi:hypothetical protein